MFERTKTPVEPVSPVSSAPQPPAPSPDAAARTAPSSPAAGTRGRTTAIIGPSIQIDGTLRGQEDLFVEGEVTVLQEAVDQRREGERHRVRRNFASCVPP